MEVDSPYLARKEISLADLQRVVRSKVYVRPDNLRLRDSDGEPNGEVHQGPFLFRELVGFGGESLGFERILDQRVIYIDGHKPNDKFTTHGTDTDGFTPIGDAWDQGLLNIESKIIVCAGIAEGYRLHEATGLPVACCVGEQKIPKLAQKIRSVTRYADQVIVAVDNDKAGYIAALRSELPYLMPKREKDFSDIYQHGGGIEAVRAEAMEPTPAPSVEDREAELDRLLNRNPDRRQDSYDPLVAHDALFYRELPMSQPEPVKSTLTKLSLVKAEVAELGYAGSLQVAHGDRHKIAGYQQFVKMAELLDLYVTDDGEHDQWLLTSAESMTLLSAMMGEGLDEALDGVPQEYSALKSRIYAGITDGLLDYSDMPGGAPAFITLAEGGHGPELRLTSDFDPEIRKVCLAARGGYQKAGGYWRFQVADADTLERTIKILANTPLRRFVFMLPEADEPSWLIGTPERTGQLQTMFVEAAGLTSQRAIHEHTQATEVDEPPLDASAVYGDTALPADEKAPATLAQVRLTREGGKPYLILRSTFDKEVVAACRKVKSRLEEHFPADPRSTFNKNDSGAWHFPVMTREALALALDTFCQADCREIGVTTPSGLIPATRETRPQLMAAMQLAEGPATQVPPGKPQERNERPPPSASPEPETSASAEHPKEQRERASTAAHSGPPPEGTVHLVGHGRRRELVLKSPFDRQVVAACRRIKTYLDQAHPEQPRASYNREDDKAWRFPVTTEKALDDAISGLCQERLPQISVVTHQGTLELIPANLAQLSARLHQEASKGRGSDDSAARPGSGKKEAGGHNGKEKVAESHANDQDGSKKHRRNNASGKSGARQHSEGRPAQAKLTFHQGTRNDYFMLRMTHFDPQIANACREAYGEYKRRDRSWHFPVFSTSDMQKTLEAICANDLARIKAHLHGQTASSAIEATANNCAKLVRHYASLRFDARPERFDRIASCWDRDKGIDRDSAAPGR